MANMKWVQCKSGPVLLNLDNVIFVRREGDSTILQYSGVQVRALRPSFGVLFPWEDALAGPPEGAAPATDDAAPAADDAAPSADDIEASAIEDVIASAKRAAQEARARADDAETSARGVEATADAAREMLAQATGDGVVKKGKRAKKR